jgi:hypothetical protein
MTSVWASTEPSGFSRQGLPEKMFKTTWSKFDWAIIPCLVLWRGTCPSLLSLTNDDLGSPQILTWHYGSRSQTIS